MGGMMSPHSGAAKVTGRDREMSDVGNLIKQPFEVKL